MKVKFWGTRGSIACPGPSTIHYGGNTSCVEIRPDDGTVIVIDCGSGAYALGRELLSNGPPPQEGHLLLSHTHWDHILGFPFFAPLFVPGSKWNIYAPGGLGRKLRKTLRVLMTYEYFPVELESLSASLQFHDLTEGMFDLGETQAMAQYLNHPGVTLGYRLETNGVVVVYSSDHEPHSPNPTAGGERSGLDAVAEQHDEDQRHIDFLQGADLVIHDTQYTEEEYQAKVGWGHAPAERCVQWAMAADVKQLALYHHDPMHDDAFIDGMVERCNDLVEKEGGTLNVFASAEGEVVTLEEDKYASPSGVYMNRSAQASEGSRSQPKVLIIDDDPDVVAMMVACLAPDGYEVLHANDGETGLEIALRDEPDLVLLDLMLPGIDGFTVCRRLRASESRRLRSTPVVLVTGMRKKEDDIGEGFKSGVSDYLLKPFKPTYLRARVHGWLQRSPGARLKLRRSGRRSYSRARCRSSMPIAP